MSASGLGRITNLVYIIVSQFNYRGIILKDQFTPDHDHHEIHGMKQTMNAEQNTNFMLIDSIFANMGRYGRRMLPMNYEPI